MDIMAVDCDDTSWMEITHVRVPAAQFDISAMELLGCVTITAGTDFVPTQSVCFKLSQMLLLLRHILLDLCECFSAPRIEWPPFFT